MSRDPLYIGALEETRPEKLDEYEATGEYAAMPKADGMWTWTKMRAPFASNKIVSRTCLEKDGAMIEDVLKVAVPQTNVTFVGELLIATSWATDEFERTGVRQTCLFDIAVDGVGKCIYEMKTWWERYQQLRWWWMGWPEEVQKVLPLLPAWESNFRQHFDEEVKNKTWGGEGLMLWRKDLRVSQAHKRADGKVLGLVKVKNVIDRSFVLVAVTTTAISKSITGRWGLCDENGIVRDVMQAGAVGLNEKTVKNCIGRVADFAGFCSFRSGSLRSARFLRWRDDLTAEDCVKVK